MESVFVLRREVRKKGSIDNSKLLRLDSSRTALTFSSARYASHDEAEADL